MILAFEQLQQAITNKGFRFFVDGEYNLNLVGIRNTQDVHANTFNDWLCVAFRASGQNLLFVFPCTTDPGTYYRDHPMNAAGTLILPTGQYPRMWRIGAHRGKYQALTQCSPITVWRDDNADSRIDYIGKRDTGYFGVNCHRATDSGTSREVGSWSAGCQVLANSFDFDVLMALAQKAASLWGNSFTYTLIEDHDL